MKINIKARLKNKAFVLGMSALIVSFIYQLFAMCKVVPSVDESAVMSVIETVCSVLAFIGVLTDPTTEGISDSARAMTYYTEADVRKGE